MSKIEELNNIFDRQIKYSEPKFRRANIVEKSLFNLTANFTVTDWRRIQTEKYFTRQLSMTELEKKEYKLQCVEYYIEKINDSQN